MALLELISYPFILLLQLALKVLLQFLHLLLVYIQLLSARFQRRLQLTHLRTNVTVILFIILYIYNKYCTLLVVLNDVSVLISGVVVQTLVAVFDSCSLKLCSNCSLLRTSTCFSWNHKMNINFMSVNVRSVVGLIYETKRRFSPVWADPQSSAGEQLLSEPHPALSEACRGPAPSATPETEPPPPTTATTKKTEKK